MVIALTHQWTKNDEDIAVNVPGIDLVLGGHDHIRYMKPCKSAQQPNKDVPLIKSGSEFHDVSVIDIALGIDQAGLKLEKGKVVKNAVGESKPELMYSQPDKMLFKIK